METEKTMVLDAKIDEKTGIAMKMVAPFVMKFEDDGIFFCPDVSKTKWETTIY